MASDVIRMAFTLQLLSPLAQRLWKPTVSASVFLVLGVEGVSRGSRELAPGQCSWDRGKAPAMGSVLSLDESSNTHSVASTLSPQGAALRHRLCYLAAQLVLLWCFLSFLVTFIPTLVYFQDFTHYPLFINF